METCHILVASHNMPFELSMHTKNVLFFRGNNNVEMKV
jgi:hypothetical protein